MRPLPFLSHCKKKAGPHARTLMCVCCVCVHVRVPCFPFVHLRLEISRDKQNERENARTAPANMGEQGGVCVRGGHCSMRCACVSVGSTACGWTLFWRRCLASVCRRCVWYVLLVKCRSGVWRYDEKGEERRSRRAGKRGGAPPSASAVRGRGTVARATDIPHTPRPPLVHSCAVTRRAGWGGG